MRIAALTILACAMAGVTQGQSTTPVNVAPAIVVQVPSAALNEKRPVTVLLPTGYAQSGRRYPVVYLLHGGGQDHTAFATRPWFGAQASRGIIIVTPNAGESWYVNSVVDPKAKFEDFVVKDLVSYIDANYRTIASRQGRAVAGVSMGGWGAMLLGLKHHPVFGSVGAMSAPYLISRQSPNMDMTVREQQTFGIPGSPERLARDPVSILATIPLESVPTLYLASGNQDIFVIDNRRFVERLTERKIPYEYREVSPRGHSWDLWDDQLVNFIEMLSRTWSQTARNAARGRP
jgi:putative tributyrin esterase